MAAPSIANWQHQILAGVGAPVTSQNLKALNAWAQAEGGSAANNPFNTTEPMPGATSYNSVNVRNYLTPQQGINATIKTLKGPIGNYGPILAALRAGTNPMAVANAIAGSQWGTGAGVIKVLGGQAPTSLDSATPSVAPMPAGQPAVPGASPKLPTLNIPAPPKPIDFTQTILGNLGKSPMGLMNAITQKAISGQKLLPTPIAQTQAPNVKSGVTPTGTTVEVQGKPTGTDAAAVKLAEHFIGTPYVWGGASPKSGFDCSGLIQYVWGKQGVSVPRTTYEQFKQGTPVPESQLKPGDAVYFTGSDPMNGLPGHVGMYIGGGKFVEAPHTGADVRVSTLAGRRDYVGARTFTV